MSVQIINIRILRLMLNRIIYYVGRKTNSFKQQLAAIVIYEKYENTPHNNIVKLRTIHSKVLCAQIEQIRTY